LICLGIVLFVLFILRKEEIRQAVEVKMKEMISNKDGKTTYLPVSSDLCVVLLGLHGVLKS